MLCLLWWNQVHLPGWGKDTDSTPGRPWSIQPLLDQDQAASYSLWPWKCCNIFWFLSKHLPILNMSLLDMAGLLGASSNELGIFFYVTSPPSCQLWNCCLSLPPPHHSFLTHLPLVLRGWGCELLINAVLCVDLPPHMSTSQDLECVLLETEPGNMQHVMHITFRAH